jgi:hypothetical protein
MDNLNREQRRPLETGEGLFLKRMDLKQMHSLPGCKNIIGSKWLPLLGITFACFILHGLIFLNERPFWDGLLLFHLIKTGNWPEIHRWLLDLGLPTAVYIHRGVGGWTSNPVLAYRIVAFLSLLVSSLAFYGICRFFGFSRGVGTQMAILSLACPVYQIPEEMIMLHGNIFVALFYLSALLAFHCTRMHGRRKWLGRWICLIGFFMSFAQESLLMYYLGFIGLYLWHVHREARDQGKLSARSCVILALRNFDYMAIPVFYFVLKQAFFPAFKGYNHPFFSPWSIVSNYWISLQNALFLPLDSAISFYSPSQAFLALLLIAFVYDRFRFPVREENPKARMSHIVLGFVGLLLWFLGAAAYVLARKPPTFVGVETRYAILLGVPVSLLLVGALHYCVPSSRYRTAVYLLFLFAFSVVTWQSHLDWQGRAVKDLAIIRSLRKTPPPAGYTSFMIMDEMPMRCKRRNKVHQVYGGAIPFEWASLFYEANPGPRLLGVCVKDEKDYQAFLERWLAHRHSLRYGLEDWQPDGKLCRMRITYVAPDWGSEKLAEWDPCGIGWRFLLLKLTRPQERQNEFLDSLLRIEFQDKDTLEVLP